MSTPHDSLQPWAFTAGRVQRRCPFIRFYCVTEEPSKTQVSADYYRIYLGGIGLVLLNKLPFVSVERVGKGKGGFLGYTHFS